MRHFRLALCSAGTNNRVRRVEARKKCGTAVALSAKVEKLSLAKKRKSELRMVPGVGPRNEELLCSEGILNVDSLRSLFMEKFSREDAAFIDYLQKTVGIRHKHHCQSIAEYLRHLDESKDRITFCIEGNISAGKTTFLSWLTEPQTAEQFEIRDLCEVVPEPVDKWQSVGGSEHNLLQKFYEDPKRHAYEFQNYVFLTRLDVNRRTFDGKQPLRLMERSVFSDRLVFVRAVHESKWMEDYQLQLYDSWFNPMLAQVPGLIPDGFIYLRAEPDTCMRRLRRRAREEEVTVSNEYLEGLHSKHEDWFNQEEWTTTRSLLLPREKKLDQYGPQVITPDPDYPDTPLPEVPVELKGSIIWLGQNGILSTRETGLEGYVVPAEVKAAMSRVPALVLDCNDDITDESDLDAKRHYAKKVKAYFEFVRRFRKPRRAFYDAEPGEILRQRWDLVDKLSDPTVRRLVEKTLAWA